VLEENVDDWTGVEQASERAKKGGIRKKRTKRREEVVYGWK